VGENDDRVVYRYSRAERLKRAPRIVQEMEERKKGGKKGFFHYVLHNRGMMYMLATILAFAVFAGLIGVTQGKGSLSIKDYAVDAKATRTISGVSVAIEVKEKGLLALLGLRGGDEPRVLTVTASTDGKHYERGDHALGRGKTSTVYLILNDASVEKIWLTLSMGGSNLELVLPVRGGAGK
jgi:hypothetical protein